MGEPDLNNFHCYFPGGGYRPNKRHGCGLPEKEAKLVADLDALIKKEGLDVRALKRERRLMLGLTQMAVAVAYSNLEEGKRIAGESCEHARLLDAIIMPFYRKMIALGYTHEDLTI